jgi:putative hydrolase of the HAD superfamily
LDRFARPAQDSPPQRSGTPVAAVVVDCLGTLVELEPPAPLLVAELGSRGVGGIDEESAAAAFGAEIDHYLRHHLEGSDTAGLARLRDDCAAVLRESLGLDPRLQGVVRAAMLAALRFRPYPDTLAALKELRRAGPAVVVASNWDCSLPETLARVGLAPLLAGVATSAEAGAAKPDPAVLHAALEIAGAHADEVVMVGDSLELDVAAAQRAGIRALLLRREGAAPPPPGVAQARSLGEAVSLVLASR